jgi:hypothetical protein
MKKILLVLLCSAGLTACGGGDVHPDVLAAFKDYMDEIGAEMTDAEARCVAGIQEDVFGREDAIRMLREPRQWNMEALSSENWESTQRKMEVAGQRVAAECDLEQA